MRHEKFLRVFALICIFSVLNVAAAPKFHKPTTRRQSPVTAAKVNPTHPPPPPPQPTQSQTPSIHHNEAPPPNYQSATQQHQQPQPISQPQQPAFQTQQFNQPQAPQPQPVVVHHVIQQQPQSSSSGGLGAVGGLAIGALAGLFKYFLIV